MGTGVGHLDYAHDDIPPFGTIRTINGTTHLQIRVLIGKPVRLAVKRVANSLIVALIGLGVPTVLLHGAPTPLRWLPVIGAGACLLALFAGMIFFILLVAASSIRVEAIVSSDKLRLKDHGNEYEIPIADIRAVRHVIYPGSRREISLEGSLGQIFFPGRRTAVEVQVPDGRLAFFQMFEEPKVAWMAENLSRLVCPDRPPVSAEAVDQSHAAERVTGSKLYGKPLRMLTLGAILVGSAATIASGFYAYRGLSSLDWPRVQGRVINSHYEEMHDSDHGPTYKAEIKYSYEVLGATYTNDDFGFSRSPGDDVVKQLVTQHPPGSTITVYYARSRPANSIVIPGLGPVHWGLVVVSLAPLLFGIHLALHLTTPEQDALAARYRVIISPVAKAWDEHPIFVRWSIPVEAWRFDIATARRSTFWMAVRVIGVTGLAVWAVHHFFAQLLPPWGVATALIIGMAGLPMVLLFLATVLTRRTPPEYAISDDGVLCPSKEKPLIPWPSIASFKVDPDAGLPHIRRLTLYLKMGVKRRIALPGGDADEKILSELSSRISEGPPPEGSSPLTVRDWAIGTCIAVAVSGLGYFSKWPAGQPLPMPWVFLLCFVAGPGTWMALALRGRRAGLGSLAVGLNMLTAIGLLLSAIARALVELHR
jgi:hypothetical protein